MKTHSITLWFIPIPLLFITLLAAQPFSLVKDITTTNNGNSSSYPTSLCIVGKSVFFLATDQVYGRQLWKTDGTAESTIMVKAIGGDGIHSLVDLNGTLFFIGYNDSLKPVLWKSDGTSAGTSIVKNISPDDNALYKAGNLLFFGVSNQLWKSDGTEGGTLMIKDIGPNYLGITGVDTTAYFVSGSQLWKSDGTPTGTVMVKDFNLVGGSVTGDLTDINDTLYFIASAPSYGSELWKSDGTEAGTIMVKDVNPGPGSGGSNMSDITYAGGIIYFVAYSGGGNSSEIWKTDGTTGGTIMVKDFNDGHGPSSLTNVNGVLFFDGFTNSTGSELWKSDGTEAGTVIVKDIIPGVYGSSPKMIGVLNGELFFVSSDSYKHSFWKSDGTEAGTFMISNIDPNAGVVSPVDGGTLFLSAADSTGKTELWKTKGTAQETLLVKNIMEEKNSNPEWLTEYKGQLYFIANTSDIYKSDGTNEGTQKVESLRLKEGTAVHDLTVINNSLLFVAQYEFGGEEIYRSNGDSGAIIYWDINQTDEYGPTTSLFAYGNNVYFSGERVTYGRELYKTDGTYPGTLLLKDICPGPGSSNPSQFINFKGIMFFVAYDGENGEELWKSDGTENGTVMVKDIGPGNTSPNNLSITDDALYFTIKNGSELWKTDGTGNGTVFVKTIGTFPYPSPFNFANLGSELFFSAIDSFGRELWKSDGTNAGTVMIKDIATGDRYSNPSCLAALNGHIYFSANDYINGTELWRSGGTEANTTMVKDIYPGGHSSFPLFLKKIDDKLMFIANNGIDGEEPWITDGTTNGTIMMQDIEPGSGGSISIYQTDPIFKQVGNKLFAVFTTTAYGTELWVMDIGSILAVNDLRFWGEKRGKNAELRWQYEDKSASSFELQKSEDGQHFLSINSQPANTNGSYQFIDFAIRGTVYYRLKTIYQNGKSSLSNVVVLKNDKVENDIFIFPNPVINTATIELYGSLNKVNTQLQLLDSKGRLLEVKTAGSSGKTSFNFSGRPAGVYYIKVINGAQSQVQRIMKF